MAMADECSKPPDVFRLYVKWVLHFRSFTILFLKEYVRLVYLFEGQKVVSVKGARVGAT